LTPGEPVWRLFTQAEASSRRLIGRDLYEPANPGHLVCMLYASQVCPFWSRSDARLGKDSEVAPGARRGSLVALMAFSEYELILPFDRPIERAAFMYHDLVEDIPFRTPNDLAQRFESARAVDHLPNEKRSYWTNDASDLRRLDRVLSDGMNRTKRSRAARLVTGPDGEYAAFPLPVV
jgi:hypothetical protein